MRPVVAVRSFRPSCWGLVIAVAATVGCDASNLGTPHPDGGAGQPGADAGPPDPGRTLRYLASNRNIDLLFLVDDSTSMRLSQDNLISNFPVLMNVLENLPGGLPNVHIGVISSDMGAGDGSIGQCDAFGGKNGIFQYQAGGSCLQTGLDPGATYISNVAGVKNYSGNLADVFTCIANLGQGGCGFEQQFAAIERALGADGHPVPPENQGFLRDDAYLAIVMITNEDDCSAAPGSQIYNTNSSMSLASEFGPPSSYRCNEFGHLCNGAHPTRQAPGNDASAQVSYTDCTSNEAEHYLLGVRDTANRIKALKADDGQVMIAAITGPPAPYVVNWRDSPIGDSSCGAASCPWPSVGHSCTSSDESFADPAVRISELVQQFGANGLLMSICGSSFAPALSQIAGEVAQYVSAPCIMGRIANRPGTAIQDCTVIDNTTGQDVPACADTGGAGVCWQMAAADGDACTGVSVSVSGAPLLDTTVNCALCAPGVSDPARGCP